MTGKWIGVALLWLGLAGTPLLAGGLDWPKNDSFELKDSEKTKEAAVRDKEAIAFIVINLELDSREERDED